MLLRNGREAFRVNTYFLTPHLMQLAEPALENALLRPIWWLCCMGSLSTCTFEHLESQMRLPQRWKVSTLLPGYYHPYD